MIGDSLTNQSSNHVKSIHFLFNKIIVFSFVIFLMNVPENACFIIVQNGHHSSCGTVAPQTYGFCTFVNVRSSRLQLRSDLLGNSFHQSTSKDNQVNTFAVFIKYMFTICHCILRLCIYIDVLYWDKCLSVDSANDFYMYPLQRYQRVIRHHQVKD